MNNKGNSSCQGKNGGIAICLVAFFKIGSVDDRGNKKLTVKVPTLVGLSH
jgi:hypothetical protein